MQVHKKGGMMTTLCVLKIGLLHITEQLYDGEVSYWASQLATVCGQIEEHIDHEISKKAPTYVTIHHFLKNNNCAVCTEREWGPRC